MQNTIPHPAPEEICGSRESHPVRDSKKKKQDGDRQIRYGQLRKHCDFK